MIPEARVPLRRVHGTPGQRGQGMSQWGLRGGGLGDPGYVVVYNGVSALLDVPGLLRQRIVVACSPNPNNSTRLSSHLSLVSACVPPTGFDR